MALNSLSRDSRGSWGSSSLAPLKTLGCRHRSHSDTPRMWHLLRGTRSLFLLSHRISLPCPAWEVTVTQKYENVQLGNTSPFELWRAESVPCRSGSFQECPCFCQCQCLYKSITHQEISWIVTVLSEISALHIIQETSTYSMFRVTEDNGCFNDIVLKHQNGEKYRDFSGW